MLSIIVATAHNRVIGADNKMPWHLPAELAYFKRTTMGHPVIMGRKTFESIGRPLLRRRNLVVTRNPHWRSDGVDAVASLDDAIETVGEDDAFVIGGATLYELALPRVQTVYQTLIDAEIDGDTFFPALDPATWIEISREHRPRDEKNSFDVDFVVFKRR